MKWQKLVGACMSVMSPIKLLRFCLRIGQGHGFAMTRWVS